MMQAPLWEKLDIQKTKESKGDVSNQPARTEHRKTNGWMVMRVCGSPVSMLPGQYGGARQCYAVVVIPSTHTHTYKHTPLTDKPHVSTETAGWFIGFSSPGNPLLSSNTSPIHPSSSFLLSPGGREGVMTHISIHTHTHTHTHTHISITRTNIHTHTHTHQHPRVHTYTHTHTHQHPRAHTYTQISIHTHTHTSASTRTHIHTLQHPHTHTHTHISIHAHTHTHKSASTHTHTHTHQHPRAHTYTHFSIHTHTHTSASTRTHIHTHQHPHAHTYTHAHTHAHTVIQAHLHPSQDIELQNTGTRHSTWLIIQSIIKLIHTSKNDASIWNQHNVFAYTEICLYNRHVSIMLLAACQFFLYSNKFISIVIMTI